MFIFMYSVLSMLVLPIKSFVDIPKKYLYMKYCHCINKSESFNKNTET